MEKDIALFGNINRLSRSLMVRIVVLIAVIVSVTLLIYNALLIQQGTKIVGDAIIAGTTSSAIFKCDSETCPEIFNGSISIDATNNEIPPIPEALLAEIEQSASAELKQTLLKEYLLIPLIIAVLAGYLIARMTTKPHRQLNRAIQTLIDKGYHGHLESSGITEFDSTTTQFNKLLDQLKETEDLRKDAMSDISHELRTPLTSAVAMIHGMSDGVVPKGKKQLEHVQEDLGKLQDIVEQLEAFINDQKKIIELNKEPVKLRSFCDKTLSKITTENGLKLTLDIDEKFELQADKKLLAQMLTNLATNTIDYAKAKIITISADSNQLTFTDDGRGVPAKALKHLFERFYRVEKSRNRKYGGLGLGLAIVKQIAEKHSWEVRAEKAKPSGLRISINFTREV